MTKKINLIFMGGFTYPRGMAGTRRIQNVINALKGHPNVAIRVILQRQSSADNVLSGVHEGTPYETVIGDVLRVTMLFALPLLYYKTVAALKTVFRPGHKNIIYFYGPLFLESVVPLSYARRLGYKIIFDVIEDYNLAREVSRSVYQHAKTRLMSRISSQMKDLSAGIVVISSHLENKYNRFTEGRVPIHYLPISVDMRCFPEKPRKVKPTVSLFYAGSFGKKDGIPVLLDAFDRLAGKHENLRLVLTGRGDKKAMREFLARMDTSSYRDRIEYRGYVDERTYYDLLNDADIPCMTRADLTYAHAGFPFKLGEFLATGKPVVASLVSDVDKFLVDRYNAMLVRPDSSSEVCEAAEFLIANRESAAAIGMRGREVAESYFDYRRQGKALLTFLKNL